MAYTNTDYSFWTNPKVRAAGKDAAFLYIAGNGFCNEYLTDGFISDTDIETVAFNAFQRQPKKAVESLVRAGLWDRVPGGYQIHDYLDYNKSKQEIEELRSKKSYAGKKSGQARAQASAQARAEPDDIAPAQAPAQAKTKQYNYVSISNLNNTTLPPLPPNEIVQFGNVYNDITGNDPQFTPEEVDAIQEIIKAGGTTADYRKALEGMRAKRYTVTTMASALKWTLGDIEKRNNGYKPTKQLSAGLDEILADAPIFAEDK
mgnify:CR=1 FL=1|jgi:hypothetical protein